MAIVKMKRLRLVGVAEEQEALLNDLLRVGCVEVSVPQVETEDPQWAGLMSRKNSAIGRIRSEIGHLSSALETLDQYAPVKESALTPRPNVTPDELFNEDNAREALDCANEINRAADVLSQVTSRMTQLQTQRSSYLPWVSLDHPLEQESTEHTELLLGVLPAKTDLNALSAELNAEDKAPLSELIRVSEDKEQIYVLLLCHKSQFQAASDVLKSKAFSSIRFKEAHGTAAQMLKGIDAQLADAEEDRTKALGRITSHSDDRKLMRQVLDRFSVEATKEEGKERLVGTDHTFFLEGWATVPEEEQLKAVLGKYTCAWELEEPSKEDYPQVPVQLRNSKLVKPLNMVTEMYSLPAYGSLDPNPLMAPFFILFYGMMMADMAYGIIMMLISVIVLRKKHPRGNIFGLIGLCGISTFIFGALTGGFLGDFIPKVTELATGTAVELPHLFTPLDDTISILIGSMILGGIQIITGMAINWYKLAKRGQFLDGLMDVGSWWLLFAGAGIGAVTGVWYVAYAGLAALILTQGRDKPTIIGKLIGGVSSLYDITSYFGDVLSYSRLMALMLAGSVIAQVFNTLGAIPGNLIFFIIVSLLGNTLNFALNMLGCYVHDLRLQCLEFFGKFYEDGGKPFEPMAIDNKYTEHVDIVKQ